jgi:hypothetical protein
VVRRAVFVRKTTFLAFCTATEWNLSPSLLHVVIFALRSLVLLASTPF